MLVPIVGRHMARVTEKSFNVRTVDYTTNLAKQCISSRNQRTGDGRQINRIEKSWWMLPIPNQQGDSNSFSSSPSLPPFSLLSSSSLLLPLLLLSLLTLPSFIFFHTLSSASLFFPPSPLSSPLFSLTLSSVSPSFPSRALSLPPLICFLKFC